LEFLKRSWGWLKWPAALGVLAWLYYTNQTALREIAGAPKSWGYLCGALLLIGTACVLTFFRWYLLVRAQQFPFRFRDALRLGFIGLVANYVAPGAVGGDIVKAFLMARGQTSRRTAAVATVVLDRILGMLALVMVGAIVALFPSTTLDHPQLQSVGRFMWAGTAAGLVGLWLMLTPAITHAPWIRRLEKLPKVGHMLGELVHGVELYQSRPATVVLALLISLAGHGGLIAGFYLCALWMKQPWVPDLLTHFYFMPTAELFGAFVPVPAGMGALEGAVQWFYERLKPETVTAEAAAAAGFMAAIAFRLVQLVIAAAGGGYYITARGEIASAMHEAEEAQHEPVPESTL